MSGLDILVLLSVPAAALVLGFGAHDARWADAR